MSASRSGSSFLLVSSFYFLLILAIPDLPWMQVIYECLPLVSRWYVVKQKMKPFAPGTRI